jgi:precorrin-6B methylase 2
MTIRLLTLSFTAAIFALSIGGCASQNYGDSLFHLQRAASGKDVIWIPTKVEMIHQMLAMAEITKNDYLIDLGSGDGVIPIEAAKKFGIRSLGIEYNPDLVALSERNAQRANVRHLVSFRQGDLFNENFSDATVLTLYLGESLNNRLKPALLKMKPGTRIISNTFRIDAWTPDRELKLNSGESAFLWIVPARFDGDWELRGLPGGSKVSMRIRQKTQFFEGTIDTGQRRPAVIEDGRLSGNQFEFKYLDHNNRPQTLTGTIGGPDSNEFIAQLSDQNNQKIVGELRSRR